VKKAFLGMMILAVLLFFGCQPPFFKEDLPKVLGIKSINANRTYVIDDFAGLGEWYILETYELSEETVNEFILHSKKILPERYVDSIAMQKKDWAITPFDTSYHDILFASINYVNGDYSLERYLKAIDKTMVKKNVYYSAYYFPSKDFPERTVLFVLDIGRRNLHVIETKFY